MIKVNGLTCGYDGKDILTNISFNLNLGENLCILGANGCGKTTLVKAICGLIPYKGNIEVFGKEVSRYKTRELGKKVAVLSQKATVYFSFSVFETVMLGRYVRLPKNIFTAVDKSHEEFVMHCLETVGIADLKNRTIDTLSGGQMQKVLLARALAQEPDVILLDEPSNHLDIKSQREIFEFLRQWSSDKKHSYIGVLHDLALAYNNFKKGLMLKNGSIVYFGELNKSKTSNLTETYDFDVINYLNEMNRTLENIDG